MAAGKTTMPVAILPERDMKSLRLKTMLLSVLGIHYGSTMLDQRTRSRCDGRTEAGKLRVLATHAPTVNGLESNPIDPLQRVAATEL